MGFILVNKSTYEFVKSGGGYTKNKKNALIYKNREDAKNNKCTNEWVMSFDCVTWE